MNKSHVAKIIIRLSEKYNQTPEVKIRINNSITNTGHGSIFLGSTYLENEKNGEECIRMLVGAHFSNNEQLKIGVFGGSCNKDEKTIYTVIRETIEEIFGISPSIQVLDNISDFLNKNTNYYYINPSSNGNSFSYIFDVSILGDFIIFLKDNNKSIGTILSYLITDDSLDESIQGKRYTIDLIKFMKERYIPKKIDTLTEIKYLSFASLNKLLDSIPSHNYNIFNFTNNRRERLEHQEFFNKHLQNDIYREILL